VGSMDTSGARRGCARKPDVGVRAVAATDTRPRRMGRRWHSGVPALTGILHRAVQGGTDARAQAAALPMPCSMRRCTREDARPCAYHDRRQQSCPTAFCPAHSVSVGGVTYCRRHAGTMQAIGELAKNPSALPDVADRGPALINYIARDLDKAIRTLLARTARPGESLIVDDAVRLAHDHQRHARWERSWRIVEHTGPVLAVTLALLEDEQSRVYVRVGAQMVADSIPPWIARRSQGVEVEAAIDISQRQMFYQLLEENISAAVIRFRAREENVAA
jgi:hypothetical protein